MIRCDTPKVLVFSNRLYCRENILLVDFTGGARELAYLVSRHANDALELLNRSIKDLLPVGHEEHSLWIGCANFEGGENGLAGSGRGDDYCALLPGFMQRPKGLKCLSLHHIGNNFRGFAVKVLLKHRV